MKSKIPKPLQKICGRAMIDWVLNSLKEAGSVNETVVVGDRKEILRKHLGKKVSYVEQNEAFGTGHATFLAMVDMQKKERIYYDKDVVILMCADTPLVNCEILKESINFHIKNNNQATVITTIARNPHGYGRVIKENDFFISRIVEQKKLNENEEQINEVNSGIYIFSFNSLYDSLKILMQSVRDEYYLTDTIEIMSKKSERVCAFQANFENVLGVNNRIQLSYARNIMNSKILEGLMEKGIDIVNLSNTYVDCGVKIGVDTIIYPGTFIEGNTVIGESCKVYASRIDNCNIGNENVIINSVLDNVTIGDKNNIGPFSHLRPGTKIESSVKIGSYVEIKNSVIDDESKIPHLSYVGDAVVEKRVNIGCGAIVANYDGAKKHKTIIENGAFIGCNSNLISPITVHENSYIASGSTITNDVPEHALAIARNRQINKENWNEKNKNEGK
jgi:bifunctional UDP-N-acetylglucosamine pyrophosphorylase/glucosamine-1-phosphate N-acetyltransferase